MTIRNSKLIAEIFFFVILLTSAYLVWSLFFPFLGALALSAIVVTICYPLHLKLTNKLPKLNASIAAFLSVLIVFSIVILPIIFLSYLVLGEAVSIYNALSSPESTTLANSISSLEAVIQRVAPGFTVDVAAVLQQSARFFMDHLVVVFAGTATTLFLFFIALIGTFYFFRDGKYFTSYLIRLSPLDDKEDSHIMVRLAVAVRSVALGIISIAAIQGILTAIGLAIFGFERAILWGFIAAIGALIPGIGTTIVFVPAVAYLIFTGAHLPALFLAIWGILAVGMIDNIIGPYLMSRGNNVHPFLILLSVLGGLVQFGPLGFILGPVIMSLFLVLVELYHAHTQKILEKS